MFNTKPFKWVALFAALILTTAGPALAQSGGLVYHECQVFDELNRPITNITTVTVRLTTTTTAATIYSDAARTLAITQPMTTTSTNTTLASGKFYWYGPDAWDYTIGDGTNTMTNYGHSSLTATNTRIIFPTYLAAVTSTAYTDAQSATFGSDADFVLAGGATGGRFTVSTTATDESPIWWFGADTAGVDVMFFAATTGDYILWDASDEQLEAVGASILVDDGSIALGDGDGLLFGDTLGTGDFKISDESDVLTIDVVVAGVGAIAIGNDADDVPLTWYAETTGAEVFFTGDDIQIDGMSLCIGEGDQIQFGDALGTGDMVISCTSNVLAFTQVSADTGTITFGADGTDIPTKWFGETAGDFIQITGDDIQIEDMSLCLADTTQLQFGDALGTGVFQISSATTILTIGQIAAGTGEVNLGVNDAGLDLKLFGDTTAEYFLWDTSEDTVTMNGGNATFTLNDAEANQFKVDAVGSVNGVAIQLETTNGGISILADGAAQGDIAIDAEDDITITTASDLTLAVTGVFSAGGAAMTNAKESVEVFTASDTLTAAESGKVCVSIGLTGAGAGDLVLTLPTAAAGLTFTFYDANSVAADDLLITAGAGDTINGGSAAASYRCSGDVVKQTLTIVAQDATSWIILSESGTWTNE